jgi:very-short-patch-repair endonuclease
MSRPAVRALDQRLAATVARQHGVVTRAQLLEVGLTSEMVDRRVRSRRLRPLHRGVYLHGALIGSLEPARAREMAAVLACGPGAVVSHRSAASLWELVAPRRRDHIDVTIPGADRGRRPGIRPHRVTALAADEATELEGVPVTSPVRTLLDLAALVRPRTLEQALAEARRRELAALEDVATALRRAGRKRGTRALRRLIAGEHIPAFTRSAAEERLLGLIRRGRLPPPETNVRVAGMEVDFVWRSHRVVVEVDGFAYHSSRRTFESDRRRDTRLAASGFQVLRVTWRQLMEEPAPLLVKLAQVLALAGA